VKGRNGKGEGLPKVLTVVKIAPLGITFMLCEPTLASFAIWSPKVSPNYLQTCFCLLKRPEERTVDVLVYAKFFF